MASGGEAHNSDSGGVDPPVRGVVADEADGPLDILRVGSTGEDGGEESGAGGMDVP